MTPIKPIPGRLYFLVAVALVAFACLLVSVMPDKHSTDQAKSSWSSTAASIQVPNPYRR